MKKREVRVQKPIRLFYGNKGLIGGYELTIGLPVAEFHVGEKLLCVWVTIGPPEPCWLVLSVTRKERNVRALFSKEYFEKIIEDGTVVKL